MAPRWTEDDGRRALHDHALDRATTACARSGPNIDADTILKMLDDREVARHPVGVRSDTAGIKPGELAHAEQLRDHPSQGFRIFIRPPLQARHNL